MAKTRITKEKNIMAETTSAERMKKLREKRKNYKIFDKEKFK